MIQKIFYQKRLIDKKLKLISIKLLKLFKIMIASLIKIFLNLQDFLHSIQHHRIFLIIFTPFLLYKKSMEKSASEVYAIST